MTTTITATCVCKSFTLPLSIPTTSLPLPSTFCLCTDCRKVSGTCGGTFIDLPRSLSIDPASYPSLTRYASSSKWNRYFCSTCSAQIFCHNPTADRVCLTTGILDRTEGVVVWEGCKYVEGTLDGGVSVWLNEIQDQAGNRRTLPKLLGQTGGETVREGSFSQPVLPPQQSTQGEDRLHAQCHCGGVKFYVTRPNEASAKVRSPYSDLIIPYHIGVSSANPSNESWFLQDRNTKYLAGTCVCPSCRLSTGAEIQTWAFIPKCNVLQEDGSSIDFNIGTLRRHNSSPGVFREFCGTCGATVFWHCEERPELLDVSVGLFDPEEGARVERWLEWWTKRVSFSELAVSTSLVQSLETGMGEWGGRKWIR